MTAILRAPGVPGDGDRHQADGAGAGDQHVLADQREAQGGVHGVAEGVEDGAELRGDGRVWWHPDVGLGDHHVLGEGAVALDADADGADAHLPAAGAAVAADAADDVAFAGDPVPDLDVADVRSPVSTTSP